MDQDKNQDMLRKVSYVVSPLRNHIGEEVTIFYARFEDSNEIYIVEGTLEDISYFKEYDDDLKTENIHLKIKDINKFNDPALFSNKRFSFLAGIVGEIPYISEIFSMDSATIDFASPESQIIAIESAKDPSIEYYKMLDLLLKKN